MRDFSNGFAVLDFSLEDVKEAVVWD